MAKVDQEVSMLEHALAYAASGWRVFPVHVAAPGGPCSCGDAFCRSPGKHPRTKGGLHDATTDEARIRAWWRGGAAWGIGLATGAGSGVFVVDVDTAEAHGVDGVSSWEGRFGPIADMATQTSRTGSGGYHIFFTYPDDQVITNSRGSLPKGVDLRGDGGYVILPPSVHPGGARYRWEEGSLHLREAPREVLSAIAEATESMAVEFSPGDPARVPLAKFNLPRKVQLMIVTPPTRGERSETDAAVCLALVVAGATNDEIRGVFAHTPIGTLGKYAERGDEYLALTVGFARGVAGERADSLDVAGDSPRWQVFTAETALEERPPINYLVEGVIWEASLNIVFGRPEAMKSLLLIDMLAAIAGGQPWLQGGGEPGWETHEAPVYWVDFDSGRRETHDRIGAALRARRLGGNFVYSSMPKPPLDASDLASVAILADVIRRTGARAVVVDNLGVVSGGVEENSAAMIGVMNNLRLLADETGAAVTLIHHSRKSVQLGGNVGESLRGHSGILAALDTSIYLQRDPGSQIITGVPAKSRRVTLPAFQAVFEFEHFEGGDVLRTSRFVGLPTDVGLTDKMVEETILEVLQGISLTQRDLVEAVKEAMPDVGVNRVRGVAAQLAVAERVRREKGPHNATVFSLP